VDHIVGLRDGGEPFELTNLQTLCGSCHGKKTRIEIGLGVIDPEREKWRDLLRGM
jgi:5-methylcytosine-specific restriction endonuclease McrA